MKIRTDFVSNSSSCSFVIASKKTLDTLVNEVSKACIKHVDEDDNKQFIKEQNKFNKAVLNYHWRATECMFLGTLLAGYQRHKYNKSEDEEFFNMIEDSIKTNNFGSSSEKEKVISANENKIVVDWPLNVYCPIMPTHRFEWVTNVYLWKEEDYSKTSNYKEAADKIVKWAKELSDNSKGEYLNKVSSRTYFISRKTIWNTRALIASGYDVVLEKWMDLDKLEDMLKNNINILAVTVNNGGDGVDDDAVYTFGGWKGQNVFRDITNVSILYSETM